MRLLILGYFGFGNVGDEAVLASELAALHRWLPAAECRVISGDPAATEQLHGVAACARTSAPALAAAVRWCDVLIAGGGSLLQDVTSARPVGLYGGLMLAAARAGRPVVAYAQGLGPLRRRSTRSVAARALHAADYLSLRDEHSLRLAEDLGVIGAELVADPALALRPAGAPPVGPPPGGRPARVAVAVRPWGQPNDWLPAMAETLAELTDQVAPVLVPMHRGQDVDLARTLAGRLAARTGRMPDLVMPDGGYAASLEALQTADLVVGMRLHALIGAAAAGVPVVPISYDPKVDAFAGQLGVPVAATVPGLERAGGAGRLQTAIGQALGWDGDRRARYRRRIAELADRAELPARRTAALVTGRADARRSDPGRMGA